METKKCSICLGHGWYITGAVKVQCTYCDNLGQEVTATKATMAREDNHAPLSDGY